jgi:hypothetical protein
MVTHITRPAGSAHFFGDSIIRRLATYLELPRSKEKCEGALFNV